MLSTVKVQVLENTVNPNCNILTADYLHCWKYAHFFWLNLPGINLHGLELPRYQTVIELCCRALCYQTICPSFLFIFINCSTTNLTFKEEKIPFINNLNLDFMSGVTLNKRDNSYVLSCKFNLTTVTLNVFLTSRKLGGTLQKDCLKSFAVLLSQLLASYISSPKLFCFSTLEVLMLLMSCLAGCRLEV